MDLKLNKEKYYSNYIESTQALFILEVMYTSFGKKSRLPIIETYNKSSESLNHLECFMDWVNFIYPNWCYQLSGFLNDADAGREGSS